MARASAPLVALSSLAALASGLRSLATGTATAPVAGNDRAAKAIFMKFPLGEAVMGDRVPCDIRLTRALSMPQPPPEGQEKTMVTLAGSCWTFIGPAQNPKN